MLTIIVVLDENILGAGEFGGLGVGGGPDGGVEHTQEPNHQRNDGLRIETRLHVLQHQKSCKQCNVKAIFRHKKN